MEVPQSEVRGVITQRQVTTTTTRQLSPGGFKQTETKVVGSESDNLQQLAVRAGNRNSDEFRTKSNIKSTAAFE